MGLFSKLTQAMRKIVSHPIEAFCDGFFVFYAMWSLTWMAGYLANMPFSALAPAFLILIPTSFLAIGLTQKFAGFDGAVLGRPTTIEYAVLLFALVVAVLATLFLHRPDGDDEVYLGMAAALLMHADQPTGSVPGFGTIPSYGPIPGFEANTQALSAYQPLKAMLSYLTGLPLLTSYYLIVPALMAAMTILVGYRLLRELVPDAWMPAMLFFLVIMLSWGDAHRTLANFGFVRMFQGKAVLVSMAVPALLFYFLHRIDSPTKKYYMIMLIAAAISSVGFSRGGIAISPILIAMLVVASIRFDQFSRRTMTLAGLLLASVAITFALSFQEQWTMNPEKLVHTPRGLVESTSHAEMLRFTLGEGLRGAFLLGCVGFSFFFAQHTRTRYVYRNYLVIFFLLLLVPWTSNFLAKTVFLSMSWRWMWVLPIPLLSSVAVGAVMHRLRTKANIGDTFAVWLLLLVAFVFASPRLVVSAGNGTEIRWPMAKISGDSIDLEPLRSTAVVRDGLLYLVPDGKGY
jgi:hypothetical protein